MADIDKYIIEPELNLKNIITESRDVAQALNEFADNLEQIEKKYAKPLKMGKWIESKGYDMHPFYVCSECGRYIKLMQGETLSDYPYCLCGAKMSEEEKE